MSRLSVPQAPLSGGAAPVGPAPVDDGVGRAVAQLGQQMFQVGRTLENDRLSRDLGRARVDMANGLSQARLEMERETNPDAIDGGWRDRIAAQRQELLGRVDPQNAEAAGLAFDELAGRHGLAVGGRAIQLRQDQGRALLAEHEVALASSPGIGDLAARDTLAGQYAAQVMDQVEAGNIPAADAAGRIWRQRQGLAESAAIRQLSEDPERLLADIDGGRYPDLASDTRERYRASATSEIDRRTDAAAREADRAAAAARIEGGRTLDAITTVARAGRRSDGEDALLQDPALKALPGYAETVAAVKLRDAIPGFAAMTPTEQAAMIETERAKPVPVGAVFDVRTLDAMEIVHDATVRSTEAAQREQARALTGKLSDLIGIAQAGRTMDGEAVLLADPAVQALPAFAEAAAAVKLRDMLPDFALLPPAEQAARIKAEAATQIARPYEDRPLSAMEAVNAASRNAWAKDPIAQAAAIGLAPAAPLPTDMSDPTAWTKAFAARRDYGLSLVDRGYIARPAFFSAAEREQIKTMAAPGQDARLRATLAATLAEGFGPEAARAIAGVSDDPVFSHVGGLLAAGGRSNVALQAFTGQTAIAAGTVSMPADASRREWLFAASGSVLADTFPDRSGPQAEILKTADALYAARAQGMNPRDNPDDAADMWREALQTAMGAGQDAGGRPTGGVREIRNRPTWLPIGVTAEDMDRTLDRATDLLDGATVRSGRNTTAIPATDVWAKASMSGGAPLFGGEPLTRHVASRAQLIAVGDGVFRLEVRTAGGMHAITDSTDPTGHFLLSWPKLRDAVAAAERAK